MFLPILFHEAALDDESYLTLPLRQAPYPDIFRESTITCSAGIWIFSVDNRMRTEERITLIYSSVQKKENYSFSRMELWYLNAAFGNKGQRRIKFEWGLVLRRKSRDEYLAKVQFIHHRYHGFFSLFISTITSKRMGMVIQVTWSYLCRNSCIYFISYEKYTEGVFDL